MRRCEEDYDDYGFGYWIIVFFHLLLLVVLIPVILLAIIGYYIYVWKFENVEQHNEKGPFVSNRR